MIIPYEYYKNVYYLEKCKKLIENKLRAFWYLESFITNKVFNHLKIKMNHIIIDYWNNFCFHISNGYFWYWEKWSPAYHVHFHFPIIWFLFYWWSVRLSRPERKLFLPVQIIFGQTNRNKVKFFYVQRNNPPTPWIQPWCFIHNYKIFE